MTPRSIRRRLTRSNAGNFRKGATNSSTVMWDREAVTFGTAVKIVTPSRIAIMSSVARIGAFST